MLQHAVSLIRCKNVATGWHMTQRDDIILHDVTQMTRESKPCRIQLWVEMQLGEVIEMNALRSGSQSRCTCRQMHHIQLHEWPYWNAMRSMANLVTVSFTTSPIDHRIHHEPIRLDQSMSESISQAPFSKREAFIVWVHVHLFMYLLMSPFGRMGWGGGVIQRWCHVYTTYRGRANGVRTREQLPWRLTTTTTYKNHQGNRENMWKK